MDDSRIVIITGGTSGIGLETVIRFATHGIRVFTCSRHPFNFHDILDSGVANQIEHLVVDVGNTDQLTDWVRSIGKRFGRIDVLVNNAAAVVSKPIGEFKESELRESLEVNLLGLMQATQTALPFMLAQKTSTPDNEDNVSDPVIINISSLAAVDPFPGFSVYGACKAFVELFTQAIQNELKEKGIKCFTIRAGAVDTPLLRRVLPGFPSSETLNPRQVADLIYQIANRTEQFPVGSPIEITQQTKSRK